MACPSPSQALDCRLFVNARLVSEIDRAPASRLPVGREGVGAAMVDVPFASEQRPPLRVEQHPQ
jgi:hypothetical protein